MGTIQKADFGRKIFGYIIWPRQTVQSKHRQRTYLYVFEESALHREKIVADKQSEKQSWLEVVMAFCSTSNDEYATRKENQSNPFRSPLNKRHAWWGVLKIIKVTAVIKSNCSPAYNSTK